MNAEAEQHIAEAYRILQPRAPPNDPLLGEVLDKVALSHMDAGRLGSAPVASSRGRLRGRPPGRSASAASFPRESALRMAAPPTSTTPRRSSKGSSPTRCPSA